MSDAHRYTLEQVETLELAPAVAHENLEGWVPTLATDGELRQALEKALNYRGDVTLTLKSGEKIEAFIFNLAVGPTLAASRLQYFAPNATEKRSVGFADIARLEFTGKDRAAGKQWEDWVKKYSERKAAGEKGIALAPEALD